MSGSARLAHPVDQRGETAGPPAELDEGGELRLAARPAPVDDELLRDAPPDVRTEIVLDQGDRQVDAGRNPRRGPDAAVPDEDALGVHRHLRVAALEPLRAVPVGGGAPAVEQAGLREQEGAGADARDAPGRHGLEPGDDPLRRRPGADDLAARNQDGIEGTVAQRLGREAEAGGTLHTHGRAGDARRHDRERVAARPEALRHLERRGRPGRVEQLKARMEHDGDASRHGGFCPISVISAMIGRR